MPFVTPRRLRINLDLPWAFSLIARLRAADPRTDASRVLATAESVHHVPSVLAAIFGLVAVFVPGRPLWVVPLAIILGGVLGFFLLRYGLFLLISPLGLLFLARLWTASPVFPGLLAHVLLLAAINICFPVSWPILVLWILGHLIALCLCWLLARYLLKPVSVGAGVVISPAEMSFFHAYRIHAERLGLSTDINLSEMEIESEDWKACFLQYALKHPRAVAASASPGAKSGDVDN
jgi:hypothetical protein